MLLDPVERGRRQQGHPQPTVGGEALLGGEVIGVELARVDPQPARGRGGVDGHELPGAGVPAAPGCRRPGRRISMATPGRGLVVGERVEVDVVDGHGLGVGPRRGLDDLGVFEMGCRLGGGRELGGELAEREVLAAPLDEAEGGDVPEARGAAVAEHDLVAVGEREQLPQPAAEPAHDRPHRGLAVAGAEVARRRRRQRGHLLGAHLGGTAPEPPVGRLEGVGDADVGGAVAEAFVTCASMAAMASPRETATNPAAGLPPGRPSPPGRASPPWSPRCPRRPPSPSTPRRRHCAPRGPTSSGSAPVSRTSPPPTTSSRPPSPPATTRSTTTTPPRPASPPLREAIAAKTGRDSGYEVAASQVLVTNGAKQAVYEAFATVLDPGDEVLVPAPVLDDLPRSHRPGRRRPRGRADRRVHRVPPHRRRARGGADPGHQGPALRVTQQPHRSRLHTRGGPRHRSVGGRRAACGSSPTRSTSTSSTAAAPSAPCPWPCPNWPTAASSSTAWPRPTP